MLICGVGAKSVAHLMKFHLLQWEVVKVKFLMNSNLTLTVLNLHQKTDPKVQQDFIGQSHYGEVKGQSKVRPLRCTPTPANQCPYQVSTSYMLRFLRYSLDKIFKLKVTTARSKVKSRSHHDAAHLQPLTNVPTKHQLPTPYGFRDIAWTRFYRSRSLWQDQRSYQGQTMTLHTYTR